MQNLPLLFFKYHTYIQHIEKYKKQFSTSNSIAWHANKLKIKNSIFSNYCMLKILFFQTIACSLCAPVQSPGSVMVTQLSATSLSDILHYAASIPELSREFSTSIIPSLVPVLISSQVDQYSVRLFILFTFSAPLCNGHLSNFL